MTRSFLLHRRVPVLLLGLILAATACGGGDDDTADTLAHGQVSGAPAGPDASTAAGASAIAVADAGGGGGSASTRATSGGSGPTSTVTGVSAPTSTATGDGTTVPPTSARSTTIASTVSTPSTGTTTATTARPAAGRLAGTVTASPTCPVERPDQPCPPRPVAGVHIEAFDRSEQLVASTDADADGRFTLTLAPGRYVLTASSGAVFPSCPSLTVEVPASGTARADIACDTGIR